MIQYPAANIAEIVCHGVLDAPPSRGMTSQDLAGSGGPMRLVPNQNIENNPMHSSPHACVPKSTFDTSGKSVRQDHHSPNEAIVTSRAETIGRRQIAPWRTRTPDPNDGIEHAAATCPMSARGLLGNIGLMAVHPCSLNS
jgi:hypothetical protein